MRVIIRSTLPAVLIALIAVVQGYAFPMQSAEAQEDSTMAAGGEADTLAAGESGESPPSRPAAADTAFAERLKLTSTSEMTLNDSYHEAGTGYNMTFKAGGGWMLGSNLLVTQKKYTGRDMDVIVQSFLNTAAKLSPGVYTLNLTLGENYMKQVSQSLSRYGKEIVVEKESAVADFKFTRPLFKSKKSQVYFRGEASRGQNDFKYDRTVAADVGGAWAYRVGEAVSLSASAGTHLKRERSDVGSIVHPGIPSHVDTVSASLNIGSGERKILRLKYSRRMGQVKLLAPPFGNALEILDNPEAAQVETNDLSGEVFHLESSIRPIRPLSIEVTFDHSLSSEDFAIEDRRDKRIEDNSLEAKANYRYSEKGSAGVTLQRSESDTEYSPGASTNFIQKDYSLGGSIRHEFHDSLDVSVSGNISLKQKFYKNKETNPRDADYLNASLSCRASTYLFKAAKVSINITTTRYETININASLSGDNRVDFKYMLVPQVEIIPYTWLTLRQGFEVRVDYTEYTFDSKRNYLNRNTILNTEAFFRISKKLSFNFLHKYNIKDTGSYFPDDSGREIYNPKNETLESWLRMNFEYRPVDGMTFFVRTSFRDQRTNILGFVDGVRIVRSSTPSESGDFRIGTTRKRPLPGNGTVDLDITYVRRFGPYISEDRREYWDVKANVKFDF